MDKVELHLALTRVLAARNPRDCASDLELLRDYIENSELVKHGRWIRAEAKGYPVKRSSIWYCSECGEKIKYNDTLGRYQKTKKTVSQVNPRCRKCDALMDGGAD